MANFAESVKKRVSVRQQGRCAHCGRDLNGLIEETEMRSVEFHHVVPQSAGGQDIDANCVALCTNTAVGMADGCHYRVHANGYYRSGVVAPPDLFPYSHGKKMSPAHVIWFGRIKASLDVADTARR